MRRVALLLWLLAGCSAPETPPADVMDRATFKRALFGTQVLEARLNHQRLIEQVSPDPGPRLYAAFFKEQGITRDRFERSFRWYSEHPALMRGIYEEVLNELDSMSARGLPFPGMAVAPEDSTAQLR